MAKKEIFMKKEGEVATIFLNRPEKRNALTLDMWRQIPDLIKECRENEKIKVVIFRGINESAFAAGADISEFTTFQTDPEGARSYNDATKEAELSIMRLNKPTIAMIHRFCVGGGCEIATACDFRFSAENGRFGITPAKLGLVYNFYGTKNLVRLVGPARAKDILFSGRLMDAQEAYEIGLIDRIYTNNELEEKTYEYAEVLASNSWISIQGSLKMIDGICSGVTEETEELSRMVLNSYSGADFKEGIKAFLEKRKPEF